MSTGTIVAGASVAISVEGGDDLTYDRWEAGANAVARGLVARRAGRVALRFDSRYWADFAVAYLGVAKAGAVAVLLSPGAALADLVRALEHAAVDGLLCVPGAEVPAGGWWVAGVEELQAGEDTGAVVTAGEPGPDEVYRPAPLAPPRPFTPIDPAWPAGPGGVLVHAWAPGTVGGRYAVRLGMAGQSSATLATFDPVQFCALVADRRATVCGLTPALAAAVVASGASRVHDLFAVARVVLSGAPTADLRARLERAFAGAAVVELGPGPAPPAVTAPVAVSQEGMLWHEQFTPGSFNLPCLVRRYRGPLDVAAMAWALGELARRHEPLRTTFAVVDGRPGQVVGDAGSLVVEVEDFYGLAAGTRDRRVADLLAGATSRPFDLAAGPLFEPRIVRLGAGDHLVVVRLHHTAFDDWSVDVFRRELSALYVARVAGVPSPLVEPATGFPSAALRRRTALDGEAGAVQLAWWRQELAGAPLATQLPIGGAGHSPGAGEPLRVDLPPALAADLRALAPRLRATPYMTVLAAFSVLVAGVTGQDDLVIATVVADRDSTDIEPLIGCFTKKVPLRLRVDGDPTFGELVARTRRSLLASLAHKGVAFAAAVQEGLGRAAADHGVVPQVSVVFQAETPQRVKLDMPGLSIGPYEVPPEARRERHFSAGPDTDRGPAWGDGAYLGSFLILSLLETVGGLSLIARGVFEPDVTRRLLDDFQAVLAAVVADPDRPVSALGGPRAPTPDADVLDVRGFRISRARTEAALARCPGVDEVTVAVRAGGAGEDQLVAYVVGDGGPPPTLAQIRHALWAERPGALWPAARVMVEPSEPPPPGGEAPDAEPLARMLAAMCGEVAGRAEDSRRSYWQDFSFLQALAEMREAGFAIGDTQVVRCRTPEALAMALATARR